MKNTDKVRKRLVIIDTLICDIQEEEQDLSDFGIYYVDLHLAAVEYLLTQNIQKLLEERILDAEESKKKILGSTREN